MTEPVARGGIAVVGIGCRFPGGANTPDRFWTLLANGVDAIAEIPPERFDVDAVFDPDATRPGKLYTRWAGFVDGVDTFDPDFFGISRREAVRVDPQQRMLLETVWEAFEDGGLPADRLAGSRTGVFIGISTHDYHDLQIYPSNRQLLDSHCSTGMALSIAANRISYVYDLRGPSLVVDTACSSSLTATHLAFRSLRDGECDLAIVGGVNAFLNPESAIGFCKASFLSPDGRCKAFDVRANGFVRGEGAGVVLLKPLERALADGDHVYAVLRGTAVNQDGRTVGITVPSPDAQEALIHEALRVAGATPSDVVYVEAHGTGTRVGDPIEATAIGRAVGVGRDASAPCLIGSVKTNIGHLEAGAGIAGLIKASLVLDRRMIPPNLHFTEPNPAIPFDSLGLRVVTSLQPWPANGSRGLVGVNSFGFGGANAHVVIEVPPAVAARPAPQASPSVHVLPISARSPEALQELARRYRDRLLEDGCPPVADVCYTAARRRSHEPYRMAVVGASHEELAEQIDLAAAAGAEGEPARAQRGRQPRIAFVFTGMGPQWWAMGRQLLEQEPVFRAAIEDCDRRFRQIGSWPLLECLTADETSSRAHEPDRATVTNLAIQVGLMALLESWGIVPDAVVGHSAGEVGSAWAAGVLSLEDALLIGYERGRLQLRAAGTGTMLGAGISEQEAEDLVRPFADRVCIAAVNSPGSVTLSGDRATLEQIAAELERRQRFNRFLRVEVPYHGPQMDPLRDELLELLAPLAPLPPSLPLVSTVTGAWVDAPLDRHYWFRNLRQPVRFADAMHVLIDDGYDLFLEIGPHPALSSLVSECLAARAKTGTVLPTLRRKEDERHVMLRSLGAMYSRGRSVDWSGVAPAGTLVQLPHYPWQRERFWFESAQASDRPSGIDSGHPLLGYRLRSVKPCWETDLARSELDYLTDHIVQGSPVFPAAAYVDMALAAAAQVAPDAAPAIEDLSFKKVLFLTNRQATPLQLHQDGRGAAFEIHSGSSDGAWAINAGGKLRSVPPDAGRRQLDLSAIRARCTTDVPVADAYEALEKRGLRYQGVFRGIQSLQRGDGEALAEIALPDGHADAPYHVHPALLDSAFQAMLAAVWSNGHGSGFGSGLYLPVSIKRLALLDKPGTRFWAHAEVSVADADALEGSISIVDEHGRVALSVESLRCKALDDAARARRAAMDELTYQLVWEPKALDDRRRSAAPLRTSAELGPRLQPLAEQIADERGWAERLRDAEPTFNAVVGHYVLAALAALGWDRRADATGDVEALADRLNVVPGHRRFFGRLVEIARSFTPAAEDADADDRTCAERLCERVLSEFPENAALVELLRRCGEQLSALLRGDVEARDVLFAPAAVTAWARFFAELPWYEFYNRLAAEAIEAAIEQVPGSAPVRILEIGAGTAGTTSAVLPRLAGRNVEYCFTDVAPFFLAQARERFRSQPSVRVASLDIESDPVAQVGADRFDIVLAANVVHATADLNRTLGHIKQVLAPGGMLVLLEVTRKMPWADLVFGITDGWWRFTDTDVRPDYALLSVPRWQTVLSAAGFESPAGVAERPRLGGESLQAVIVATLSQSAAAAAVDARAGAAKDWLVFADSTGVAERVAATLRARGDRPVMVRKGPAFAAGEDTFSIQPTDTDDMGRLLGALDAAGMAPQGLIHCWGLDAPESPDFTGLEAAEAQAAICGSVLGLVQACEARSRALPPIWFVTAGAQAVEGGTDGANVAQSPIWGIGRVLTSEQPSLRCRLIDLGASPDGQRVDRLIEEIDSDDLEEEVAIRDGGRYVTRLHRTRIADAAGAVQTRALSPDTHAFRLGIGTPGALESLALRETTGTRPGPGEIVIRVMASGINFRDVMLALGLLPPMAIPGSGGETILGFECAGIVTATGDGVDDLKPGDDVMAVAIGSFGSQVVTRAEMAARKPAHLSFEQAATIPLVFVTAHYGLNHLARLAPGERVLIHAATGGVGLAAIQLAKRAGATIFATAGNPDKRAYLKALGVEHVMDSRSLAFADEVLEATGGEGVDVVLNSITGEAIQKGLSILRPYGRFLEMGKRDIYADSSIGLLPFDRNLAFCSIALERMCVDRTAYVGSMLREIAALIESRELEPIPHTAFDLSEAEAAVRMLAQAKHIGKVVLTVRQPAYEVAPDPYRPICRGDGTYVISGGLGGFGLLVARWMVDQGARHLVLMSRRGAPGPESQAAFDALCATPAEVVVVKGDVSNESDVTRMFDDVRRTMPPVRGILHAAMVLDDGALARLSMERLNAVVTPKVAGAWNLHRATVQDDLDFFVMFSSTTSVLGAKGQGNYAAANLFLDALAPYRRSLGLPALTINWGALGEVGYVSQHEDIVQHLRRHGMDAFSPSEALDVLGEALRHDLSRLLVMRLDWQRMSAVDASAAVIKRTQRLAHYVTIDQSGGSATGAREGVLAMLAAAPRDEWPALVERQVAERVAKVLGTSAKKVDVERPLTEMGVDSLMAVELQVVVERDFAVSLPLAELLEGATVRHISSKLFDEVAGQAASTPQPQPSPADEPPVAASEPEAPSGEVAPAAAAASPPPAGEAIPETDAPRSSDSPVLVMHRSPEAEKPVAPPAAPVDATTSGAREDTDAQRTAQTTAGSGSVDYRSLDYGAWSPRQRFYKRAIGSLFRLLAPIDVQGLENIPKTGPVLLAVNHLSMMDIPVLLTILPRRGVCIATDTMQKHRWIRWFLDIGNTIWVRRGKADQDALIKGLTVLRSGGLLGLAPEGTRSRTGGLMRGQTGAAYLAAEAPAPILPVAAYGQERILGNLRRLRRTRVHVRIGPLITVTPGDKTSARLQHETERVMTALAGMLPPEYRGVYGSDAAPSEELGARRGQSR